jgi:cytochrome c peroxidase
MHNGLFDLIGVLRAYNNGMATLRRKPDQANDPLFPTKSEHLRPLGLNASDLSDLRAFLQSLEETRLRVRPPTLPGLTPPPAIEEP